MEIDPKFGEAKIYLIFGDTVTRHHAACPAALAALGQGQDYLRPDEAAKTRLYAQARDWLRVDLGLCSKTTIGGYARGYNVGGLLHLKECSDLGGFRDATALSKIPEAERKQWQSLWAEIDALFDLRNVSGQQEVESQRFLDKAIAGFRSAIRLAPDHADSHCRLGNALIRKGKLDEAIAAYREAIRLKPDHAEAHYSLGNALKGQGKLDEAVAEYREAIRLKPDHAEAHCNLGNALKSQGKLDEAIAEYREAIRLKPDYAEAHSNLGGILKSRGDDAGALAMYRKRREINKRATGLDPSAEIRSQTLDWLKAERNTCSKLIDGGGAAHKPKPSRTSSGRRSKPIWPPSATLRPWPGSPSPSGRNGNRSGPTLTACSSGPKGTPRRPWLPRVRCRRRLPSRTQTPPPRP